VGGWHVLIGLGGEVAVIEILYGDPMGYRVCPQEGL